MNEMMKIVVLQEYLKALYEAYEVFQQDYKRLHKRSKMHNAETVGEYYQRWKNKMLAEIRKVEIMLASFCKRDKQHCKPKKKYNYVFIH